MLKKTRNIAVFIVIACLLMIKVLSNKETAQVSSDWGQQCTNVKCLWNRKSQNKVKISLIDTGVDVNKHILKSVIWKNEDEIQNNLDDDSNGYIDDLSGWNFLENRPLEMNDTKDLHGTMCADVIERCSNGEIEIMVLKVLDPENDNRGKCIDIINAIRYAERNGAAICNLSLCSYVKNSMLKKAIQDSKMLFVVPAGNSDCMGENIDIHKVYPASYNLDNVITVTSIDENNERSYQANYGKKTVDIAAPGAHIYSRVLSGKYIEGTSFAVSYVTAIAGLIMQYKKLDAISTKKWIIKSAKSYEALDCEVKQGKVLYVNNKLM